MPFVRLTRLRVDESPAGDYNELSPGPAPPAFFAVAARDSIPAGFQEATP